MILINKFFIKLLHVKVANVEITQILIKSVHARAMNDSKL